MNKKKDSVSVQSEKRPPLIIGTSRIMRHLDQDIRMLARDQRQVLFSGPTGTGKELFADLYHFCSPRRGKIFEKINCTGWPESLIDDALFGHERGAFTGASTARPGIIEATDQGILFLDEIGDLPGFVQGKLLRVMEDGMVRRLGSNKPRKVDVLFIAATNKLGAIREDLKYRFTAHPEVPALTSRREDLPILIQHFLKGSSLKRIEERCLLRLLYYDWPGNIRELKAVLDSAISYANIHHTLLDEHLRAMIPEVWPHKEEDLFSRSKEEIQAFERKISRTETVELDDEFIVKCNQLLEPVSTDTIRGLPEYSDTTESQLKRIADLYETYVRHVDFLESAIDLPVDEAKAKFEGYYIRAVFERYARNQKKIAEHMKKSPSTVSRMKNKLH